MYDGLSKDDLRIILAHQEYVTTLRGNGPHDWRVSQAYYWAGRFLDSIEALSAESESSAKRDDGEGEGTRA